MNEQSRERIKKALEDAGLNDVELDEVVGGLADGCSSCSQACSPGCQPGNVNPSSTKQIS